MNNPDYFPKLNLVECKKIACRWGKRYPFIKKILLYAGLNRSFNYVLVAEMESDDNANYLKLNRDWMRNNNWDNGGFQTPILGKGDHGYGYKEERKSDVFSDHWQAIIKRSEGDIRYAEFARACILSEFVWILYDSDAQVHEDAEDTKTIPIDLIQKAKPEVELIYEALKKKVGFSGREVGIEERWKAAAIDQFDDFAKTFTLVKRRYLEEMDYALDYNQSKRDFVGALLKIIVKNQTGKTFGGQKLYDQYKKV